jgi:hypothetical protein
VFSIVLQIRDLFVEVRACIASFAEQAVHLWGRLVLRIQLARVRIVYVQNRDLSAVPPFVLGHSAVGDAMPIQYECPICTEHNRPLPMRWFTTICRHSFHEECLLGAIERHDANLFGGVALPCPICRHDMRLVAV